MKPKSNVVADAGNISKTRKKRRHFVIKNKVDGVKKNKPISKKVKKEITENLKQITDGKLDESTVKRVHVEPPFSRFVKSYDGSNLSDTHKAMLQQFVDKKLVFSRRVKRFLNMLRTSFPNFVGSEEERKEFFLELKKIYAQTDRTAYSKNEDSETSESVTSNLAIIMPKSEPLENPNEDSETSESITSNSAIIVPKSEPLENPLESRTTRRRKKKKNERAALKLIKENNEPSEKRETVIGGVKGKRKNPKLVEEKDEVSAKLETIFGGVKGNRNKKSNPKVIEKKNEITKKVEMAFGGVKGKKNKKKNLKPLKTDYVEKLEDNKMPKKKVKNVLKQMSSENSGFYEEMDVS